MGVIALRPSGRSTEPLAAKRERDGDSALRLSFPLTGTRPGRAPPPWRPRLVGGSSSACSTLHTTSSSPAQKLLATAPPAPAPQKGKAEISRARTEEWAMAKGDAQKRARLARPRPAPLHPLRRGPNGPHGPSLRVGWAGEGCPVPRGPFGPVAFDKVGRAASRLELTQSGV